MYICAVGYEFELRANSGLFSVEEKIFAIKILPRKNLDRKDLTGKQCRPTKEVSECFTDYFRTESGIKEKVYEAYSFVTEQIESACRVIH